MDQIWIYDPGREVILQVCKYARFARRGRAAPGLGWWPGVPWGWARRGGGAGAFFGFINSVTRGTTTHHHHTDRRKHELPSLLRWWWVVVNVLASWTRALRRRTALLGDAVDFYYRRGQVQRPIFASELLILHRRHGS